MRFTRIAKRADRLLETISGWWKELPVGYILSEESYGRLIARLSDKLNVDDSSCIYGSYTSYICSKVTKKSLYNLCYHLSANLDRFKQYETIPFNSVGYEKSEEEFHILGVPRRDDKRVTLTLRAMTGVRAGREDTLSLYIGSLSSWCYACGCSGRKYDISNFYSALSNAYIVLRLEPVGAARTLDRCMIEPIPDPVTITFNRKNLYRYRFLVDDCPNEMPLHDSVDDYCVKYCPLGCSKCPASAHEYDWPKGICTSCGKSDVYIVPNDTCCIDCSRRKSND